MRKRCAGRKKSKILSLGKFDPYRYMGAGRGEEMGRRGVARMTIRIGMGTMTM
jgi:hypothetical protein